MLAILAVATAAFVSTNIDDMFVLIGFFSHRAYSTAQIVTGQYIGIATLVAVSALCALVSLAIAPTYTGLLGIVPIVIGAKNLWKVLRPDYDEQSISTQGAGKYLSVAAVTIANGGDNIGIYTPLFATISYSDFLITTLVFALLTGLWCVAGNWLVHHRAFGTLIRYWGNRLLPIVLIALGFYILWHASSFALLGSVNR